MRASRDERNRSTPRRPRRSIAPPEELLPRVLLHEGTGVDASPTSRARRRRRGRPDRPRDADAERRRRAASLRLEPLQLGVPRAGSLAPDRARAFARRASTSSTSPTTRAGPAIEKVIEPRGARREDGLHAPAHRPLHAGRQRRDQHARRPRRQRRRRLRGPRRADLRGQGPLGERRRDAAAELRLLVPAAQERARSRREFGEPNAYEAGLRHRRRRRRALRAAAALLGPRRAAARCRRSTSASRDWSRSRCAGCTTPRPSRASSARRCRATSSASTARTAASGPSR